MQAAVNLRNGLYLTEAGEILPITDYFDVDGDECEAEEAVAAVAGPDSADRWHSIDLREFEAPPVH